MEIEIIRLFLFETLHRLRLNKFVILYHLVS